MRKPLFILKIIVVVLHYNFEAIHNKDYSVVKTFKAVSQGSPFFYCTQCIINYIISLLLSRFVFMYSKHLII